MRRAQEQRGDLHEEIGKEEEREWKLKPFQKIGEDAGEKKQSELQAMQSYGIQRSSSIEILLFLTMEIPFCVPWSVESEVCLFQSHGIPGGVSLNSSLSEGEIYFGNLIIQTVISYSNILLKASVSPDWEL